MRALIVLLVGVALLIPAAFFLQQPRGAWSLLFDALGLTLGALGTLTVASALVLSLWRIIRGGP